MDALLTKLRNYSRFLELEDNIPYWESQIPELEERIEELKWNKRQKELEMLQVKEPNVFQRLFGRAEEKKELLNKQIREITAAHTAASWDLEGLQKKLREGKQELEILRDSQKAYEDAKAESVLSPGQESRLLMEQITAFAPLALETAWRVLTTLEDARPWIRSNRIMAEGSRKMELLYRAQDHSRRLLKVLAALPEGAADPCTRLENLYDYICGATSEYKQQDRLETVQIELHTLRNQLKLLIGE